MYFPQFKWKFECIFPMSYSWNKIKKSLLEACFVVGCGSATGFSEKQKSGMFSQIERKFESICMHRLIEGMGWYPDVILCSDTFVHFPWIISNSTGTFKDLKYVFWKLNITSYSWNQTKKSLLDACFVVGCGSVTSFSEKQKSGTFIWIIYRPSYKRRDNKQKFSLNFRLKIT